MYLRKPIVEMSSVLRTRMAKGDRGVLRRGARTARRSLAMVTTRHRERSKTLPSPGPSHLLLVRSASRHPSDPSRCDVWLPGCVGAKSAEGTRNSR